MRSRSSIASVVLVVAGVVMGLVFLGSGLPSYARSSALVSEHLARARGFVREEMRAKLVDDEVALAKFLASDYFAAYEEGNWQRADQLRAEVRLLNDMLSARRHAASAAWKLALVCVVLFAAAAYLRWRDSVGRN